MGSRFPKVNEDYVEHYSRIDPRLGLVMDLPSESIFSCHKYFDADFVRRDPFYNEFLLPHKFRFVAGCRLSQADGTAAIFGMHRSQEQGAFQDDDLRLIGGLIPHLKRAIGVRQRLRSVGDRAAADAAALQELATAVVTVDAAGRVRTANEAALRLLGAGDGLVVRAGRLGAVDPAAEARLLRLMAEAAGAARRRGGGGGAVALRREGGGTYAVLVAPLAPGHAMAAGAPMALVLATDPTAAPRTLGRTLVELYGFSQAEACLAVLLGRGLTLKEAAGEREVGLETVRSQLRSMLQKAGVHRQADLVRLLARLPEVRARSTG
jgi:DNA-binding CsgD family transcriptional regulator/PAS domain-containing protein